MNGVREYASKEVEVEIQKKLVQICKENGVIPEIAVIINEDKKIKHSLKCILRCATDDFLIMPTLRFFKDTEGLLNKTDQQQTATTTVPEQNSNRSGTEFKPPLKVPGKQTISKIKPKVQEV